MLDVDRYSLHTALWLHQQLVERYGATTVDRLLPLAHTTGVPLSTWADAWEAADGDTRLFDAAAAYWPALSPLDAVHLLRSFLGAERTTHCAAPAAPTNPLPVRLYADTAQRCETAAAERLVRRHLLSDPSDGTRSITPP
jgi:hypothetical protein